MAQQQEMVIMTRSFDFLTWLLPATNHFPRAHRFTVTSRLLNAAFDLREHLEAANRRLIYDDDEGRARLNQLQAADEALDRVRVYIRLAARWQWFKGGQYRHAAEMVDEIGRLLGGWQKATKGG